MLNLNTSFTYWMLPSRHEYIDFTYCRPAKHYYIPDLPLVVILKQINGITA